MLTLNLTRTQRFRARNKAQKVWSLWLEVLRHVRSRPVNGRSVDACEQPVSDHFFRPEKDRARMERRSSLSAERFGDTAHQCEAVEVEALCRLIVAKAREVGLRIGDNDNW